LLEPGRLYALLYLLAFIAAYFMSHDKYKKTGRVPFRPVAGLQVMDEAVGRATEMGRAIHFTTGRGVLEAQTFAGLDVLKYVANMAAASDTRLIVTNHRSHVYPLTVEIVRQAYVSQGKLDKYRPDDVRFISEEQSAYVAGIMGIMEREGVVTNIMVGQFWAEGLQIAETAYKVGAIQIAGTTDGSQLPFLVVACDYTLIGEEIYAAGAYFNPDPIKVGALMAQDVCKYIAVATMVIGSILLTLGSDAIVEFMKL